MDNKVLSHVFFMYCIQTQKKTLMGHGKNHHKIEIMLNPDFSNFIAHFTSIGGKIKRGKTPENFATRAKMSAKNKLISILTDKKIIATPMPWTEANAVCFTECPWTSLLAQTRLYSPYGIGFNKPFVFSRNGGPAIYIRPDHYKAQMEGRGFTTHLWPFIIPFVPSYRPDWMKEQYPMNDCNYAHEREWRVPQDFPFEYKDIEFVIMKNYEDMAKLPKALKDAIGREKFILMDNYRFME